MTPDDREDIEYEANRELGQAEQRMIDSRAEWYRRMRQERGWA